MMLLITKLRNSIKGDDKKQYIDEVFDESKIKNYLDKLSNGSHGSLLPL